MYQFVLKPVTTAPAPVRSHLLRCFSPVFILSPLTYQDFLEETLRKSIKPKKAKAAVLNSIIERTYHCVVDQKKKKKLSHNTRKNYSQASWEGLDTYKYSDYPESGGGGGE